MSVKVDILVIVTIKNARVWGYSAYVVILGQHTFCIVVSWCLNFQSGDFDFRIVSLMINIRPKSQWLFLFELFIPQWELWFSFYCEMLKYLVYFSLCRPRSSLTKHRSDSVSQPTKWKIQKKSVAIYTRTWLGGIHLPHDICKEVLCEASVV